MSCNGYRSRRDPAPYYEPAFGIEEELWLDDATADEEARIYGRAAVDIAAEREISLNEAPGQGEILAVGPGTVSVDYAAGSRYRAREILLDDAVDDQLLAELWAEGIVNEADTALESDELLVQGTYTPRPASLGDYILTGADSKRYPRADPWI